MIAREKVIKGFECCKYENKLHCNQCPYDYNGRGNERYECTAELSADALAMLKEQEEIEPINSYGTLRCGNCRNIVGYNDGRGCGYRNNFCSKCGRAVKWDADGA